MTELNVQNTDQDYWNHKTQTLTASLGDTCQDSRVWGALKGGSWGTLEEGS